MRAKVRVVSGVDRAARRGHRQASRSVVYEPRAAASSGSRLTLLLLHQGVVPSVNLVERDRLPTITGTTMQLAWSRRLDAWGRPSVPGIAIAGDGAGIAGAEAPRTRGRIAALGAAHRLGSIDARNATTRDAAAPRATLASLRARRAFPRYALSAGEGIPCARGRHHRLPLRGGHRRADPRRRWRSAPPVPTR